MKIQNTATGVTAEVEMVLPLPTCQNSLMHALYKTVYVVEDLGATFTFTDLDRALDALKAEIFLQAENIKFFVTEAPAHLDETSWPNGLPQMVEEFKKLADALHRRSMLVELEILNCMWDEADEYCMGRYEDRVYTENDIAAKALDLWRNSQYVNSERKKR